MKSSQKRVDWIDIAKFFSIYAVFIGHYINVADGSYLAGKLGTFVWEWHVPFLFFLSGCVEWFRYDRNIKQKIVSDIKKILIPFFVFGIVALVFACFYDNYSYEAMIESLKNLLKGVRRNTFFVTQIWFLSCLFVMKLMFHIISIPKKKIITVFLGFIVWFVGNRFLYDYSTHIFWNIDSAFHYFFYFIMGFAMFPFLQKILSERKYMPVKYSLLVISGLYTVAIYYNRIRVYDYYGKYMFFILIMGIIVFQCCLSSLFEDFEWMKNLGKKTLYLCGNEGLMNYTFTVVSEMIGITWVITRPISVCIKAMVTIILIDRLICPGEKRIIDKISEHLTFDHAIAKQNKNDSN